MAAAIVMPTGAASPFQAENSRAITELTEWAARDLIDGRSPSIVAKEAGMSVRTAYRWRAALVGIESVRVGGWVATFAQRRQGPPVRISAWERST